ncbi:Asp-tRNA(Asn)/Glu-tRNA(Gln) amidotransferase subunit GatC [Candidatus Peregrinibacteria bacterium]|nr:Asp-tRNA(Asn)/Glu-tRNA(Gln) amidotransferase subunit GatC [Candidatus Peregrinibacteria bacterium]
MTKLTLDQVRHLAALARLTLTGDEEKRFLQELTDILKYVEKLQDVNTEGVEPTSQMNQLQNIYRPDVIEQQHIKPDDILSCSPLPIIEHQIQTPSAHG